MKILIIGNGFDLAHGLPTRYRDFLHFIRTIIQIINDKQYEELEWVETQEEIKPFIYDKFNDICRDSEWELLIKDNIWIDYFLQCDMFQKENWIDFENEMCKVIKGIEESKKRKGTALYDEVLDLNDAFLNSVLLNDEFGTKKFESAMMGRKSPKTKEPITYRNLIEKLDIDLRKMIRALERYLVEYVGQIECDVYSEDILKVVNEFNEMKPEEKFDKVLSFNYTDTFKTVYGKDMQVDYDFIHGRAGNNDVVTNNMVLGIDEYLNDEQKNIEIDFVKFKKYFQRIHKMTGCKYKNWSDTIKEDCASITDMPLIRKEISKGNIDFISGKVHKVFIFGHSLDITDKDVLRDLILNDNVFTTIYYKNEDIFAQLITNLVKVIGQDELICRMGGVTKTIEFVKQKDMITH